MSNLSRQLIKSQQLTGNELMFILNKNIKKLNANGARLLMRGASQNF